MSDAAQMQKLYQAVILEHNKNPRNFRALEPCSVKAEGFNPLCGDHYWVYLKTDDDERIEMTGFEGHGCAISKASTSSMREGSKGKN